MNEVLRKAGVIYIVRTGECLACGYCCPPACPHFKDGACLIHDTKREFCGLCGQTHEDCADAPTFPMRKWNPDCGYRFYIRGEDLEAVAVEVCYAEDNPVK